MRSENSLDEKGRIEDGTRMIVEKMLSAVTLQQRLLLLSNSAISGPTFAMRHDNPVSDAFSVQADGEGRWAMVQIVR